jgi:hypothetical protein
MSLSEVARLRARIEAEYQAAWNGLHGLASGTARHDFINKKMEDMGGSVEELRQVAGSEVAMKIVVEVMNDVSTPDENILPPKPASPALIDETPPANQPNALYLVTFPDGFRLFLRKQEGSERCHIVVDNVAT